MSYGPWPLLLWSTLTRNMRCMYCSSADQMLGMLTIQYTYRHVTVLSVGLSVGLFEHFVIGFRFAINRESGLKEWFLAKAIVLLVQLRYGLQMVKDTHDSTLLARWLLSPNWPNWQPVMSFRPHLVSSVFLVQKKIESMQAGRKQNEN